MSLQAISGDETKIVQLNLQKKERSDTAWEKKYMKDRSKALLLTLQALAPLFFSHKSSKRYSERFQEII